ncbi:dTDP-4-dehydrorhamnose reductase [Galbibacter pacificus]|uniref:dTDP-4-dehydrorhamnose reductase n=1 Tax=Galbibacter pacificus TaxID=2996052 RepID=A0ABT6FNX7_9FLAO|nr:dTDP-4-dehydrorhamnose reductase [Galbibacter pacificus]MDG3581291.1 dTDP-4-dehydrorhamnose reductase [Galbibacter pacificus]MDG3584769.1 dTDP-4-dehydrorhamnose reductase [Galbibacter pacificus]
MKEDKKQLASKSIKPTTVLVTGANGLLGRTIQKYKDDYPKINFLFCSSKELDITIKESIKKNFKKNKPDYCINCAAYTNVEKAEKEPEKAFLVNAEGAKNLAEVCKESGTVLIHISTDYVFDGEKRTPYTVKDIPNPINEYGKSKLQGEKYIQQILERYFIIRTSWLYSKEFEKNFYLTILEKAKRGEELRITDAQIGCPTDTENLTKYILELINIPLPLEGKGENYGIHHFCDKKQMTWYGFAISILEKNKIDNMILINDNSYKTIAKRPIYSVLE